MDAAATAVSIKLMADIADLQSKMQQAKAIMNDTMQGVERAVEIGKKALVGFAGVASVDAFAGMIKGNIEAAAAMGRLATQAGVTTEAMSGLTATGKISQTSAETIAAAMNKMTKAVSSTDEEAKGAGAAIAALGINFQDFTKLSADQRMLEVAKAMDKFQDGTGKSAAAMAIMGKSGAEMLPFLEDLATVGELQAKVTTEQSERAKDFELNLKRVKASSEAWKKELSMGMLPALDDASKAWLEVVNGAGGLRAEIIKLSRDGTIADWTRGAVIGLTYLADMMTVVWRGIKTLAMGFGSYLAAGVQLAQGNVSGAIEGLKGLGSDLSDMWSEQTMGQRFRARMEELQGIKRASDAAKPALNDDFQRKAAKPQKEERDKELADMQALVKATEQRIAVAQAASQSLEPLTEGEKKLAELMATSTAGYSAEALAERQMAEYWLTNELKLEKYIAARTKEEKATVAAAEARLKYVDSLQKGQEKAEADVAALQEQTARIGLTKEAVAELDAAKLNLMATELERQAIRAYDRNFDEEEYAALMKTAQAYRDLGKAKIVNAQTEQAATDFNTLWQSVDRTAHDTFVNVFQGGQDAFTKLRDTLKATLLDLLYQMTLRKWVLNIVASVTGSGAAGIAQAAIPGMSGAGQGSGILNFLGMIGGAAGSGFAAGLGAVFGGAGTMGALSAGASLIGTGTMAGTSAGLGMIGGAALPWIGGALAVKQLMDYKVTPNGGAIVANVGANGASSVASRTDFIQEGGLFGGGTTHNSSWADADAGTTGYVDAAVKTVTAANTAYATALGMNADALKGYTAQLEINVSGMDATAAKAAVDAAVLRFQSDQIAAAYGDSLKAVARDGETSAQTLQRLATDLTGTNAMLGNLGTSLYDLSVAGAAAASTFISAMGGMAAAQSQLNAYYQSYYTQEEQRNNAIKQAQADLQAAGITDYSAAQIGAANRADIRAVVDYYATRKDTEEGAKKWAAVIKVANNLSAVTPALNTIAASAPAAPPPVVASFGSDSGGGGSGSAVQSATAAIVSALQAGADALLQEANRIRGVVDASGGAQGLADVQAQFAIKTALARAGDEEALKALPAISQALTPLQDASATTFEEMQWMRSQTAASLIETARIAAEVKAAAAQASSARQAVPGQSVDYSPTPYYQDRTLEWLRSQNTSGSYASSFDGYEYANGRWQPIGMPQMGSVMPDGQHTVDTDPATGALRLKNLDGSWADYIPHFDVGTNYVPRDMLAMIHEGEEIKPKAWNPAAGGVTGNEEVVAVLQQIQVDLSEARSELERIKENTFRSSYTADMWEANGLPPTRTA